jgi:hypothetical protein
MGAERDFERELAAALRTWLDAEPAPHPRWTDAPARTRRPRSATRAGAPLRLLAVAVLASGAVGAALLIGGLTRQDDVTAGGLCAPFDAYPAVGATPAPPPTAAPMPSVGPDSALTAEALRPGEVAVVGDERGPAILLRASEPRLCERYPNVRPLVASAGWPPDLGDKFTLVVVRVELEVLRPGFLRGWIPGSAQPFQVRRADTPNPTGMSSQPLTAGADLPGTDFRGRVAPPAGFTWSGDLVFHVPGGASTELFLEYRSDAMAMVEPPLATWLVGTTEATEAPEPVFGGMPPTPGPPAAGRITPGEVAWVGDGDRAYGVWAGRVGEVEAYPGVEPARGRFLEVWTAYLPTAEMPPAAGPGAWRAVTVDGTELVVHHTASGLREAEQRRLVQPLAGQGGPGGWLVIDAPAEGEVRLQYRQGGEGPVLFEVVVREG